MNRRIISVVALGLIWSLLLFSSCKKDDPVPLKAETNAVLLAGPKGSSKEWKLREFTYQVDGGSAQSPTLPACFMDNIYTFFNNDEQDYECTEGTTQCYTSDEIESGTWSFTLDGILLNIGVRKTITPNGLFSSDIFVEVDSADSIVGVYNGGYTPYPTFVQELDENNLVLEVTRDNGSSKITYTLTFTPA